MKTKLLTLIFIGVLCLPFFGLGKTHLDTNPHTHTIPSVVFYFFPTSLSGFNYIHGSGPSAAQSFQINDVLALERSYTINASLGYEVSLEANNNFTNMLIIPNTIIDLGPVDVYIRLKSSMPVGIHSGTIHIFAPDPADFCVAAYPTPGIKTSVPARLVQSSPLSSTSSCPGT